MVIPDALKVLRLQHGHRYCQLGALAASVGWKHKEAVATLEAKRKVKVRRAEFAGAGGVHLLAGQGSGNGAPWGG